MARYGSKASRGHGIPEAMEQVLTNESRIPPRLARQQLPDPVLARAAQFFAHVRAWIFHVLSFKPEELDLAENGLADWTGQ